MRIYIIKINVGAYLIGMRGRLPRYEVINMLLRRLDVLNVGECVRWTDKRCLSRSNRFWAKVLACLSAVIAF